MCICNLVEESANSLLTVKLRKASIDSLFVFMVIFLWLSANKTSELTQSPINFIEHYDFKIKTVVTSSKEKLGSTESEHINKRQFGYFKIKYYFDILSLIAFYIFLVLYNLTFVKYNFGNVTDNDCIKNSLKIIDFVLN